ncbi:MAG TPA: DUF5715 family protein [Pyrinomonadaceae bacterium]|nr:DUF5715 family protein [Pyrinomonadaceae bacterium]
MRARGLVPAAALLLAVLSSLVAAQGCRRREKAAASIPAPESAPPAMVDPWREAALKVEADRGEPTGRGAPGVEVPPQLKHSEDRRLFLAVQIAEWRRGARARPHDFAELASLIRGGALVELPALGKDFILYGVGYSATDEPFTHYDKATGRGVTIYGGEEELKQERARIADELKQSGEELKALRKALAETPKAERELRKALQGEAAEKERAAAALKARQKLLDDFYNDGESRRLIAAERETLAALAADFGGRAYNLDDAASRKAMKVRMLSFLRPEALKILEEVAAGYAEKFERPLPVTSLVRPDEYQRQLRETNPNATLAEPPPHTTGLAFDIFYKHMTAAEQNFLMAELARMRDEGRVEALRELRDHFHVFAFPSGRPDDELIRRVLEGDTKKKKKAEPKAPARKPARKR